jgi:hypothetical protein
MSTSNSDVRVILEPLYAAAVAEQRRLLACTEGLDLLDQTGDSELSTAARATRVAAIKAVVATIPTEWTGAPS